MKSFKLDIKFVLKSADYFVKIGLRGGWGVYTTRLLLKNEPVEVIDSTRLLGTIISNDLSWDQNISKIVKNANARMELVRRVASFGTPVEDIKNIYILFVRSILEQSATVWHSSLTQENINDLERVQKSAIKVILQENYSSYKQGLAQLNIESLASRREQLCLNFAQKCVKSEKLKHMFPLNEKSLEMKTRHLLTKKYSKSHQSSTCKIY